jgi:sugar lactone lactonase YvrE
MRRPNSGGRCTIRGIVTKTVSFSLLTALVVSGCASSPRVDRGEKRILYPPPPQEPRIEFLTSFSTSSDVSEKTGWFEKFIIGMPKEKPILKPYGFDFWEDSLYICDTVLASLIEIDFGEHDLRYIVPSGAGKLSKPINITIDTDGTKYIADAGRGEVVILDRDNQYVGVFASKDGSRPTDVAIGRDRLYVAELESRSVGVWDKTARTHLFNIPGTESSREREILFSPVNLVLDDEENLFVSDLGAARVQKYDRDGRYLVSIGSIGDSHGQFVRPKGIDLDRAGRLYVVDAATEVVQIFDADGNLLLFFGEPRDDAAPLNLPATVRINTSLLPYFIPFSGSGMVLEQLIFVSSQYGAHKISVFGFGASK